MDRSNFERLTTIAIENLPDEFQSKLENIDIVVQDWPDQYQMDKLSLKRGEMLLGLYEGVPQTKRSHYGLVPPDKITIFQKPIEAQCGQHDTKIAIEITKVVKHEIAHHFGISDSRLEQLENERKK
ncbi:metallopeptidase family protein [Chloroflexota bacterium]